MNKNMHASYNRRFLKNVLKKKKRESFSSIFVQVCFFFDLFGTSYHSSFSKFQCQNRTGGIINQNFSLTLEKRVPPLQWKHSFKNLNKLVVQNLFDSSRIKVTEFTKSFIPTDQVLSCNLCMIMVLRQLQDKYFVQHCFHAKFIKT